MTLLKRFFGPLLIGLFAGWIAATTNNEWIVRILYTISENFLSFLLWFAPLMTVVYVTTGINKIKDDLKAFLIRFVIVLIVTLLLCGVFTAVISVLIVPYLVSPFTFAQGAWPEPYYVIELSPILDVFTAIILGLLLGYFLDTKSTSIKIITELEKFINQVVKKVIIPFSPFWIIGSFAASQYSSQGVALIKTDFLLSILILLIQGLWLGIMFFVSSKYAKIGFKKMAKAGFKIYTIVVSLAGNTSGIIIPIIIEEQEKLGLDKQKAKFISASSFNMPGSLISNVVFMYGVAILFSVDVSPEQLLVYVVGLTFLLIVSPAVVGGVFAITSQLLTPIFGFTPDMISLMNTLYFKQGTSNSAVNNAADFYLTGLTHDKSYQVDEELEFDVL